MLAELDAGWHMGGAAATLPSPLRPSSVTRQRIHGLWPATAAHDDNSGLLSRSARVSMTTDVCDFLDLTDVGAAGASTAGGGATSPGCSLQASMLNLLLSRLPEPPASQPRDSEGPDSLSALADELPVPPASPPTSPRSRASVADGAVAGGAPAPPVAGQFDPTEAVAGESPLVSTTFLPALETPVMSRPRRGTEIGHQQQQQGAQSLGPLHGLAPSGRAASPALSLLDGEMPPASPLFAHISPADIRRARQSIRDARRARSRLAGNTPDAKRATWCVAEAEPLFASLHRANNTPARASLAGILDGWTPPADVAPAQEGHDGWLGRRAPLPPLHPGSPVADRPSTPPHHANNAAADCVAPPPTLTAQSAPSTAAAASAAAARASTGSCDRPLRCFQVHVHELFSSPLTRSVAAVGAHAPHVAIAELDSSSSTSCGSEDESLPPSPTDTAVDDDVSAALRAVLKPFPLVLALSDRARGASLCSSRRSSVQPSRLRIPSRLGCGGGGGMGRRPRSTPVLSFVVPDSPAGAAAGAADRFVQSVDIEKMVQAHLPHLYARICPSDAVAEDAAAAAGALRGRTPSASSAMTLAESTAAGSMCEYAESHQSASSDDTLHPSRRGSGAAPQLQLLLRKPERLSQAGSSAAAAAALKIRRPTAAAVVAVEHPSRLQARRRVHTDSQIPPVAEHRRRSEVQALLSQANAVLSSGRRRTPAPPPAPLPVGRLRPPRASLPLVGPGGIQRLGSLSAGASRRASTLSPPGLRMSGAAWDGAVSGIPSPGSGLLTPTTGPLATALIRPQHKLERTRSGESLSEPISPLALIPVRATSLTAPRSARLSMSLAPVRALPVAGTVTRIPLATPTVRRLHATAMPRPAAPTLGRIPRPTMPAAYADDSDSDVSSMVFSPQLAPTTGPQRASWRRGPVPWAGAPAAHEEAFLTLRPVHTPDIVPCTMDPRLVERAMTPMLKTTVRPVPAIHARMASRDSMSSSKHTLRSSEVAAVAPVPVAAKRLSAVPEVQADQVSRLSPICSPQPSPRPSTESKRRLRAPFMSRKWSKPAAAPQTPPPPPTPLSAEPKKHASRIPTLQKARSLWSLRVLHAK